MLSVVGEEEDQVVEEGIPVGVVGESGQVGETEGHVTVMTGAQLQLHTGTDGQVLDEFIFSRNKSGISSFDSLLPDDGTTAMRKISKSEKR